MVESLVNVKSEIPDLCLACAGTRAMIRTPKVIQLIQLILALASMMMFCMNDTFMCQSYDDEVGRVVDLFQF